MEPPRPLVCGNLKNSKKMENNQHTQLVVLMILFEMKHHIDVYGHSYKAWLGNERLLVRRCCRAALDNWWGEPVRIYKLCTNQDCKHIFSQA